MLTDDIMVRVESKNIHGKTSYKVERLPISMIAKILSKNGDKKSYHELITTDRIRLFFDIDDSYDQASLDNLLQQELGFLP